MGAQTPSGQLSNLLHNTFGFTQLVRLEGRGIGIDLTFYFSFKKKKFLGIFLGGVGIFSTTNVINLPRSSSSLTQVLSMLRSRMPDIWMVQVIIITVILHLNLLTLGENIISKNRTTVILLLMFPSGR